MTDLEKLQHEALRAFAPCGRCSHSECVMGRAALTALKEQQKREAAEIAELSAPPPSVETELTQEAERLGMYPGAESKEEPRCVDMVFSSPEDHAARCPEYAKARAEYMSLQSLCAEHHRNLVIARRELAEARAQAFEEAARIVEELRWEDIRIDAPDGRGWLPEASLDNIAAAIRERTTSTAPAPDESEKERAQARAQAFEEAQDAIRQAVAGYARNWLSADQAVAAIRKCAKKKP